MPTLKNSSRYIKYIISPFIRFTNQSFLVFLTSSERSTLQHRSGTVTTYDNGLIMCPIHIIYFCYGASNSSVRFTHMLCYRFQLNFIIQLIAHIIKFIEIASPSYKHFLYVYIFIIY